MSSLMDHSPVHMRNVLHLVKETLNASAGLLYWIGEPFGLTMIADNQLDAFLSGYRGGMGRYDPINAHRVCRTQSRVAFLDMTTRSNVRDDYQVYKDFAKSSGVCATATMVITHRGHPMIGIGMMKFHSDGAFSPEAMGIATSLQRYFEKELIFNPDIRRSFVERQLQRRFRLSAREIEVMRLVSDGATNHDISVILGIGEATVKTHLKNSLDKLGVDTRRGAMRMLLEPDSWN